MGSDKAMKTFLFDAVATFEAEDLEDAFRKLSEHFRALAEDEDSDLFESETSITIKPIDEIK